MREIIRAGIDSIDKGQLEAAKSLGMSPGLAMRRIVLPQAARVIVPPLEWDPDTGTDNVRQTPPHSNSRKLSPPMYPRPRLIFLVQRMHAWQWSLTFRVFLAHP